MKQLQGLKVMLVWPPNQAWPEAVSGVDAVQWLKQVQVIVGGYAQQVPLYGERFILSEGEPSLHIKTAWADEDGYAKRLEENPHASRYFGSRLVGHVAIIAEVFE